MSGAQRLAQTDLAGAFGDRDQHDVDDADRTQGQRNHTNHAQEIIHAVEDPGHAFVVLDGVPIFE